MLFFAYDDFTFLGETLLLDFSGVSFDDFAFFFSVFEEIFFEVFAESFVVVLLLPTLGLDSFTTDFVEFLDTVVLRDAFEATFVVFFAETSLLDLVDFTLALVLLDVTLEDLDESFELVAFLEV